jgi:hypothetical protein
MIGQTEKIAPADRKLYALRDVTGTVESPYLICASIMSKKLAEGTDALVLDVKTGSGAFMKKEEDAVFLAELMVETGERMGKQMVALITDMNQPLGRMVGNALEVQECIDVARRRTRRICANCVWIGRPGCSFWAALRRRWRGQAALRADHRLRQGFRDVPADGRVAGRRHQRDRRSFRLPGTDHRVEVPSPRAGYVTGIRVRTGGHGLRDPGRRARTQRRFGRSGGRHRGS